jgi:hypothetical protein
MVYRRAGSHGVGGISPPAGREGQSNMFVTDVNIQPNRAGVPGIASREPICKSTGPILTRIGPCDRGRKPPLM